MKKDNRGRLMFIALLLTAALTLNIPFSAITLSARAEESKPVADNHVILSTEDATAQSLRMAEELESEGIVLLRNENNALPLAAGAKVNLFGYASIDPIYGGTGSGAGDTSSNVDAVTGLQNAGLMVNEELVQFYRESGVSRAQQSGFSGSDFTPAEVSASSYPEDILAGAKEYSDTAVIVISRIGGEGGDLPMDMYAKGLSSTDDGRHYLELTQDEEDLLALVKDQGFAKVIILINASNVMELGFAENVDACLWIGSPGTVGFNAVGKVLTGEVNPSGRLTDTYAYDLTSSPAYWNAGDFSYSNLNGRNYVEYAEGIYVGYRYYETAAADGMIDYAAAVQYPFGYGLSYTSFEQNIESYSAEAGVITMQVKVTNTGDAAGKDVAQVYYTAPYTPGGIEKAHVVLAVFSKTGLLQPGESEVLTISFPAEEMASFDSKGAGCYVLEAGRYEIKLMRNAHEVIESREYTVESTVVYDMNNPRSTDRNAAVTRFADVENGQIETYVSRSDWTGTVPQTRTETKEASAAVADAFTNKVPYTVSEDDPEITFADNGLKMSDMTGLAWDDPKWELLLQQLNVEDMANMILNGGWSTPAVESVGKPATADIDGPAGLNSLISSLRGVSFPSEVVIGSTWNTALLEEFGRVYAAEAKANGVAGLYAPGMNIHRTPFSGRNFEYYSEDGLLSGKLGAAQVRGAASEGVYMYAKHFVLNDQDENRLHLSVWTNEQAMREIYLKPFEITVKEGKTTAIMSSYSYLGTVWAGASRALITDVLRGEWGFTGMVVTDSAMANIDWMDPNLAIRSGNDMMLCLMGASLDSSSNTAQIAMREACHNILYTQANSAAMWVNTDLAYPVKEAQPDEAVKETASNGMELYDLADGWLGCHVYLNEDNTFKVTFDYGGDSNGIEAMAGTWEQVSETEMNLKPESGDPIPVTLDEGVWSCEIIETNTHTACHPKAEAGTAEEVPATVSPETGMELYDLADFWLGCHVYINADNTFSVAFDYGAGYEGIESITGTWERVSDTELALTTDSGDTITVTLADNVWCCELKDPNTQTVCHPKLEVPAAEAAAPAVSPETGMELYDLADFWLGCHVYVNADNTFSVAFDYGAGYEGIESITGTWERVSNTELTLTPVSGDAITVTLADNVWSCELKDPNTQTVCHPKLEVPAAEVAAPAVSPETGMELYDLADFWLGCHVVINADGTFTVAYDYSEEYAGIVNASGTWERVGDKELVLHSEGGEDISVTLADGAWSCEVKDPNTQTVCHPKLEVGETTSAETASGEAVTWIVQYLDSDGTVLATAETTDASALPEVEIPVKEGFRFAGWQTRPNVTKEDLILGVSPYEVPAGASSLYGGAGTAIDSLESTEGNTVIVYARWAETVEIHNAEELQAMSEDLYGYYVLAEDIDLSGTQWIPVGMYFSNYETVNAPYWTYAFRGTLDGKYHTISGLNIGNWLADVAAMEGTENAVWRDDGTYSGSEAAFFGAMAKAEIRDLVIDKPVVNVTSDGDATPYAAVVVGFDIGSTLSNITVIEPSVTVTASDPNAQSRTSAWAAASGLVAGGWSDIITGCSVTDAKITLNGEPVRSHGGEYYIGSMLGEGYAFMDANSATYELNVNIEDKSQAVTDTELVVNVGGMGGTNTTQTNGTYTGTMNIRVVKPVGAATVSVGGLTGSQRYQVAENNTLKADINTDFQLDPEQGEVYVGQVIGSTNVPYCIVQLIFATPGDVAFSGCRNNHAEVTLNGETVTVANGQVLTVNGEPLPYIANGDLALEDTNYVSNINDVIAEYGSAVPASFLQNAVIVLVDEQ